ncbi:MAG: hypothetical protein G8345_14295 [Magnetococcales bacterium]|nr:hypothetical protein [Magnetococcales bacterium]NGZ28047.1 hypothetical protein [Magnetococcales bacterium]
MKTLLPLLEPGLLGKSVGVIGRFNHANQLEKIAEVEPVSPLNARDVAARLEAFHQLQDGWLDGKGVAPKPDGLIWLADSFHRYYPKELILPYLYPTAEGGIQAEWTLEDYEISLEVDLVSKQAEWHCLNMVTDWQEEKTLTLTHESAWNWLVKRLLSLKAENGG